MTEFDLFEAIGNIDDDKITYAADKKKSPAILKIASLAACLALIAFAATRLPFAVNTIEYPQDANAKTESASDKRLTADKSFALPTQDVAADADDFEYSIKRTYSKEILALYESISRAMQNKELPFVLTCGIYENPIRVTVEVNTKDAELINKVKAFDASGTLLEIKHASSDTCIDILTNEE